MPTRNRSQPHTLDEQLADHRARLAAEAEGGPDKVAVLTKIESLDRASHMNEWLSPRQP
jgi:hypothetical protein